MLFVHTNCHRCSLCSLMPSLSAQVREKSESVDEQHWWIQKHATWELREIQVLQFHANDQNSRLEVLYQLLQCLCIMLKTDKQKMDSQLTRLLQPHCMKHPTVFDSPAHPRVKLHRVWKHQTEDTVYYPLHVGHLRRAWVIFIDYWDLMNGTLTSVLAGVMIFAE